MIYTINSLILVRKEIEMKKRYVVKVEKVKSIEFELAADSKKEAEKMVEEIIYKTKILDLDLIDYQKKYYYVITRKSRKYK